MSTHELEATNAQSAQSIILGKRDEQHITFQQPVTPIQKLLRLQRSYGNRRMQGMVNLLRKSDGEPEIAPEVEEAINSARVGGKALDNKVRAQMEPFFGADFTGVRVHDDAESDVLNKAVNARAFTVGQDIFFREGEYKPGNSQGQELLAHELTHVVQQGDGVRPKMAVSQPEDANEIEADQVALRFLHMPSPNPDLTIARQTTQTSPGLVAIDYGIDLVSQPTPTSCWAAALAMIVGFRDSRSCSADEIALRANMSVNDSYGWSAIQTAITVWGLSEMAPMSAQPDYWASLLETHGPLWIVEVGAPYHAVVIKGMYGSGSPDATEVWINNPWPPNQGALEYKTFADFDNEFGLGAGAQAAIVYA